MSLSLYDISVATYLQTLDGVLRVLDKGRGHFEAEGRPLGEIVSLRLAEDMLPFGFQVLSVAHHSAGSVRGLMQGEFRPPEGPFDQDYGALQQRVREAREELAALGREPVDARLGEEVKFIFGEHVLPFTAENFVLSFSLPNLFFHAATTYDLLRMQGVALGKRDFLGPLRMKR